MTYIFVYKTINLINNKFYIGVHATNNLNDGYFGSGTLIRKAIKKYGIHNFKREILQFTSSYEEAFNIEAQLVTNEFLKNKMVYNRALGGSGGAPGALNPMFGKKHSEETKQKIKTKAIGRTSKLKGSKFSNTRREAHSKLAKIRLSDPTKNPMFGKKHSEETKQKIKMSQLKHKSHMWGKTGERCHNFGKKHSEETKQKMSKARNNKCSIPPMPGKQNPRWKGFIVTPFGVFETMLEACKNLKSTKKTILMKLKSDDYPKWYRTKEL